MIPEGWEKRNLDEISKFKMGFAFKSKDSVPSGVQILRMGNLYKNKLDLHRSPVYISDDLLGDYDGFALCENDLMMSLTGTMGKRDYGFTINIPSGAPRLLLINGLSKYHPKTIALKLFAIPTSIKHIFRCIIFFTWWYKAGKPFC